MNFRLYFALLVLSLSVAACNENEASSYALPPTDPSSDNQTIALPPAPATPTIYAPAYGCLSAVTILDYVVQSCIDKPTPNQNDTVQLQARMSEFGNPLIEIPFKAIFYFKTSRIECSGISNDEGIAICFLNIGFATPDYEVLVEVQFDNNGLEYRSETSFTPCNGYISNPPGKRAKPVAG